MGRRLLYIALWAAAIAAGAILAVPFPGSPVPITLQTLAVLLAGALLGSRDGEWAVLLYILLGILGLPVFAGGGAGPGVLLGPSGGYLLGFVAGAWLQGRLAPCQGPVRWPRSLLDFLLGHGVILAAGGFWLAGFLGFERALHGGVLPFLPGALLKSAVGAATLVLLRNRPLRGPAE